MVDHREPPSRHRTVIGHAFGVGRLGLRLVLEREDDISVDGEAADAETAGRLARSLLPHFLILQDRLVVVGFTGPLPPQTALVLLGMDESRAAADAACRRGAAGYLCLDRADVGLAPMLRELSGAARG